MKIICVGRNYAKHAAELNNPIPDDPIIFTKPDSALLRENRDFYYPEFSEDVHYECELVLRIGKMGKFIDQKFAKGYVDAIALGIDFTARDMQQKAKEKGLPWALAKGFHGSAPISPFLPVGHFPNWADIRFTCEINGEIRQEGHTANMLYSSEYLIAYISRFFTLTKGDLIFTGTPAGVGPVKVGDHITGHLEGKKMLDFHVR